MTQPQRPIVISPRILEALTEWTLTTPGHHLNMVVFRDDTYTATDGRRFVIGPCKTHGHAIGIEARYIAAAVATFDVLSEGQGKPPPTLSILPAEDGRVGFDFDPMGTTSEPPGIRLLAPAHDPVTAGFPSKEAFVGLIGKDKPTTGLYNYALNPDFLAAIGRVHAATVPKDDENGVRAIAWSGITKDVDGKMRNTGPVAFENSAGVRFVIMPIRWKFA